MIGKSNAGGGGGNVTIDGVRVKNDLALKSMFGDLSLSSLPYNFYGGCAVVLNNEIHILGTNYNENYAINHYKFNGTSWVQVSTLPYGFYNGSAVVLNGEIHILGSDAGTDVQKNHFLIYIILYIII